MPRGQKTLPVTRPICADTRFSLPDVLNDHCWEVGFSPALSLFTTYGLRASRMRVFPAFTLDEQTVQDPAQYFIPPEVRFSSTNFITLAFSPFQGIDVQYNLWVPTSQIVLGEIVCSNQTQNTRSLQVDWQAHLSPLAGGSPMKHTQSGMSTVLKGECGDLFPVFYLSGEASPSRSAIPGLTARYLLLPSGSKHSTWVLASLSTADASFQMARQFSSRSLDVEKLRVEMTDRLDQVHITSAQPRVNEILQLSRVRARQLLMPPMANFKSPTFVNARNPDTGHYQRQDLLEINPEWSGQTLPQLWMMAQSLLPGSPELVRGFITNMLTRRPTRGGIDHRVGVNGTLTGHAALPLMAQLVADLHPMLNDLPWLEEIFPDLLAALNYWIIEQPGGSLRIKGLSHPIQLGAQISDDNTAAASEIWIRLKSENNILLLSLLIREVADLVQIARWLGKTTELDWLGNLKAQLVNLLLSSRDESTGLFRHPESLADRSSTGTVVHVYKRNGNYTPRRRLPMRGRLYLRITGSQHLPADFHCALTISRDAVAETLQVKPSDFIVIGNTHIFVSDQACDFIESFKISNLPPGLTLEVGQPGYAYADLLQLLALSTGVLTPSQVDQLLRHLPVRDFYIGNGLSLLPAQPGKPELLAPAFLVGLIVEGLLRHEKIHLADQVFNQHFIKKQAPGDGVSTNSLNPARLTLDELVPARLFLKIRGVVRFTDREVILSHFIKRKQDAVTVQYNKIELRLKPFLTEIHTQSGDVIYLNRAGPNRVILE